MGKVPVDPKELISLGPGRPRVLTLGVSLGIFRGVSVGGGKFELGERYNMVVGLGNILLIFAYCGLVVEIQPLNC